MISTSYLGGDDYSPIPRSNSCRQGLFATENWIVTKRRICVKRRYRYPTPLHNTAGECERFVVFVKQLVVARRPVCLDSCHHV